MIFFGIVSEVKLGEGAVEGVGRGIRQVKTRDKKILKRISVKLVLVIHIELSILWPWISRHLWSNFGFERNVVIYLICCWFSLMQNIWTRIDKIQPTHAFLSFQKSLQLENIAMYLFHI